MQYAKLNGSDDETYKEEIPYTNNMVDKPPPFEKNCLRFDETFKGCSYSTWIQKWSIWLFLLFHRITPLMTIVFRGVLRG